MHKTPSLKKSEIGMETIEMQGRSIQMSTSIYILFFIYTLLLTVMQLKGEQLTIHLIKACML